MIHLEEITLDKKEILNRYFKDNNIVEFTFTNLFLWKNIEDIKYCIINKAICISYKDEEGDLYISFPIGDLVNIKEIIKEILNYFVEIKDKPRISVYNEKSGAILNEEFPDVFDIVEDENHADYIYKVQDLISLSGKKYHKKKNHVNKFEKLYKYEYKKITEENLLECKEAFDKWYEAKNGTEDVLPAKEAIYGLFNNFKELDVIGRSNIC